MQKTLFLIVQVLQIRCSFLFWPPNPRQGDIICFSLQTLLEVCVEEWISFYAVIKRGLDLGTKTTV